MIMYLFHKETALSATFVRCYGMLRKKLHNKRIVPDKTIKSITIMVLIFSGLHMFGQEIEFRPNVNKDSLFNASVTRIPVARQSEYRTMYNEGDERERDFLLFMISMPVSSKQELIDNYEIRKASILNLKQEYGKLVPKDYIVDIEFEPESKILTIAEQVTIKIYKIKSQKQREVICEKWNLSPNSNELLEAVKSVGWTKETLAFIKTLLAAANCISIENGDATQIGFSRSGMGKYSYDIYEHPLTKDEAKKKNDGCNYIYYKENVVLEYGGGAIGQQCFEEE